MPAPAPVHPLLALQRSAGNHALARRLQRPVLQRMKMRQDSDDGDVWVDVQAPDWDSLDMLAIISLRTDINYGDVQLTAEEEAKLAQRERELKGLGGRPAATSSATPAPARPTADWRTWIPDKSRLPANQKKRSNQRAAEGDAAPAEAVVWSTSEPDEHNLAMQMHRRDREALAAVVRAAAKSSDQRLKNSAERILAGETLLYALTPTADSAARAKLAGQPGMRAFFGYPHPNPFVTEPVAGHVLDATVADYQTANMADTTKIVFDSPDSGGFRTPIGSKIFITQPSRIDAINALRKQLGESGEFAPPTEVLKHESQHEVDVLFNREIRGESRTTALALAEYRTEFRAYTAQDAAWLHEPIDPREQDEFGLSFGDPVQFHIFRQIYRNYPRVKAAWDKDARLRDGTPFRFAVLRMRGELRAISANPDNSPRIERFWTSLGRIPEPQDTGPLIAALMAFDAPDRAALAENAHYRALPLPAWLREIVDALLTDPGADVGGRVEAAKQAKAQERAAEARAADAERRKRPPDKDVLTAAFTSWAEVEASLKIVRTPQGTPALGDEYVVEELETWRKYEPLGDGLEAFVINTSHQWIDWWAVLDARPK